MGRRQGRIFLPIRPNIARWHFGQESLRGTPRHLTVTVWYEVGGKQHKQHQQQKPKPKQSRKNRWGKFQHHFVCAFERLPKWLRFDAQRKHLTPTRQTIHNFKWTHRATLPSSWLSFFSPFWPGPLTVRPSFRANELFLRFSTTIPPSCSKSISLSLSPLGLGLGLGLGLFINAGKTSLIYFDYLYAESRTNANSRFSLIYYTMFISIFTS